MTLYTNTHLSGFLGVKRLYAFVVVLALCYPLAPAVQGQNQQPALEGRRRLVVKIAPEYPRTPRRMRLGGTVKVIAVVGPDGKVKRVEPVGGSPLLLEAAERAIAQWKYAPGGESEESVELHFNP